MMCDFNVTVELRQANGFAPGWAVSFPRHESVRTSAGPRVTKTLCTQVWERKDSFDPIETKPGWKLNATAFGQFLTTPCTYHKLKTVFSWIPDPGDLHFQKEKPCTAEQKADADSQLPEKITLLCSDFTVL